MPLPEENRKIARAADQAARRRKARLYARQYLKLHPCVDCGERDVRVLEFDHIDPKEKKFNISRWCSDGGNLKTLEKEIKKCQVRCSNCHRIRTVEERHCYPEKMRGKFGVNKKAPKWPPCDI